MSTLVDCMHSSVQLRTKTNELMNRTALIRLDLTLFDLIRLDLIWLDSIRFDVIRLDRIWFNPIWLDLVRLERT